MGYAGKVTVGGSTHLIGSTLYGTCETAAGTAAKVVTCADFTTLITGVTIHVKFTNSNSVANPTLNVNSTGAKNIYRYGTTAPSTSAATSWNAGSVVSFTYDGNYWQMNDWMNTDGNNAVTQTATSANAAYEVLFSVTADNTTRTEGARKNSNLTFNPSTGNLTVTQINGVTVGNSPKFTDANTTYSAGTGLSLSSTTFSVNLANNATTTSSGYALDARMGKTLQTEIDKRPIYIPNEANIYELTTWASGVLYSNGTKAMVAVLFPATMTYTGSWVPYIAIYNMTGWFRYTDGSGFFVGDGAVLDTYLENYNTTYKAAYEMDPFHADIGNSKNVIFGVDIRLVKSSGNFGSTKPLPFTGKVYIKFGLHEV